MVVDQGLFQDVPSGVSVWFQHGCVFVTSTESTEPIEATANDVGWEEAMSFRPERPQPEPQPETVRVLVQYVYVCFSRSVHLLARPSG